MLDKPFVYVRKKKETKTNKLKQQHQSATHEEHKQTPHRISNLSRLKNTHYQG